MADHIHTLNAAADAVDAALAGCRDWEPTGLKHGQFGFDLAADAAATDVLRRAGLRVLSEESGLERGDGPVAVLDPVDGSTNASRGIRYFATSICVVDAQGPLAAVVHDHGSGERFEALRGGGARCDGETLRPPAPRPLAESVVGVNGWPPGRGGWAQYRTLGAAALELCAVAAGRLDGYLDFYLGTGYPDYEAVMPNVLYRNLAGRRFVDVSLAAGFGHLQKGHAVAFADLDGDGDLDVFEQMGGAYPGDRFGDALFRNPGFGNRWLALRLVGTGSNRSAIGARVRVDLVDPDGDRRSVHRRVNGGGSFGGNPLRQTIGLERPAVIERVTVYWPATDLSQTFAAVQPDRLYRLVEGHDELSPVSPRP